MPLVAVGHDRFQPFPVHRADDHTYSLSHAPSVLVATLAQNTQLVHARLVENLRLDNPLAQAPWLASPFSLTRPSGLAALNAEVTRQAATVAYIDDFKLMMIVILLSLPLLLLVRPTRRERPAPAAGVAAAADD